MDYSRTKRHALLGMAAVPTATYTVAALGAAPVAVVAAPFALLLAGGAALGVAVGSQFTRK